MTPAPSLVDDQCLDRLMWALALLQSPRPAGQALRVRVMPHGAGQLTGRGRWLRRLNLKAVAWGHAGQPWGERHPTEVWHTLPDQAAYTFDPFRTLLPTCEEIYLAASHYEAQLAPWPQWHQAPARGLIGHIQHLAETEALGLHLPLMGRSGIVEFTAAESVELLVKSLAVTFPGEPFDVEPDGCPGPGVLVTWTNGPDEHAVAHIARFFERRVGGPGSPWQGQSEPVLWVDQQGELTEAVHVLDRVGILRFYSPAALEWAAGQRSCPSEAAALLAGTDLREAGFD
jgi:hypothetical protein